MWSFHGEEIAHGVLRFVAERDSNPATFTDVLAGWHTDAAFRAQFNAILADAPFSAFRWETPGITAATAATHPFEFVLLDAPGLARRPDPDAFAEHFRAATQGDTVLAFPNLSGDAVMVVPCPVADHSAYGHLAAFVRHAPEAQRAALWIAVGAALTNRLSAKPVWLSTAGAGVSWLHVRLDDRPKYYGHATYRTRPA